MRRGEAVPLHALLVEQKARLLPKHPLAEAIGYALNQWPALTLFTTDPAVPIHNNLAKQQMKRLALLRKNALFVATPRGGETAAILSSMTSTCRRHEIDPQAYLTQLLANLPDTPVGDLDRIQFSRPITSVSSVGLGRAAAACAGFRAGSCSESEAVPAVCVPLVFDCSAGIISFSPLLLFSGPHSGGLLHALQNREAPFLAPKNTRSKTTILLPGDDRTRVQPKDTEGQHSCILEAIGVGRCSCVPLTVPASHEPDIRTEGDAALR